jgi:hypothetical protein
MIPKPKPPTCARCGIQEGSRSRNKVLPERLELMPVDPRSWLLCSRCRGLMAELKPIPREAS